MANQKRSKITPGMLTYKESQLTTDILGRKKIPVRMALGKERPDLYGSMALLDVDIWGEEGIFVDVENDSAHVNIHISTDDAQTLCDLLHKAIEKRKK